MEKPMSSSSDIKASTTDDLRLRNYRAGLQQKNDIETREIESRHNDDVQRMLDHYKNQFDDLRQAYDVQISQEAEALDERLQNIRANAEERVTLEKHTADEEVSKLKAANTQRISEYKKNSDLQIDQLRKELQATTEDLHEKARKSAKKDREVSKA